MTDQTQRNPKELKIIELPNGKELSDPVEERHEFVLLIEASKSNPNGDPDTGNMPRLQPDTMKGLITDVCLKRKIRNFFSLYRPDGSILGNEANEQGYRIFIKVNAVLQQLMESDDIAQSAEQIFRDYELGEKFKWKKTRQRKCRE